MMYAQSKIENYLGLIYPTFAWALNIKTRQKPSISYLGLQRRHLGNRITLMQ